MKKVNQKFSLQTICRLLGYSSQAYHKKQKQRMMLQYNEQLILQQIDAIRKYQPRCGGRKLFIMLQSFFLQHKITMGRDIFFDLLRHNKLLVRKTKRSIHTTNSKHHFRRYPNMVKDFTPLKAHELWVADITYIPLKNRFAYLFLITDAYSRKIVGFHVSDDMKVSSATMALRKALAQKPPETIVIHHSDRGIQYCSTAYVQLLQQHHAHISMTQNGDPYENAIAERVNGILKTELISRYYDTIDTASIHIARCITIYNYKRRHSSLNWQIPHEVHQQQGPQIRRWKNYYQNNTKNKANMQPT
ncbi:MAG: IS3 family transposase [Cytophagia bacterium]|nr:MAG: IS3 family transposase [Cytophagia bacterium]